MWKPKL